MSLPEPYYHDEESGITIYCADCRQILPYLPNVDLVFTSPPYANQRNYNLDSFDWDSVVPLAIDLIPQHETTQVLVNLGLVHKDGCVNLYWQKLFSLENWRLFGWYVWDQGSGLPGDWRGRFAPSHEFVFHFNRASVALNKTVRSSTGGIRKAGCRMRKQDGSITGGCDEMVQQFKTLDTVLRITRQMDRSGPENEHPAVFPTKLPSTIIQAFPCETILDPFMGSGTTLVAAKQLGKKCIGIEIDEAYCKIAVERLAQGNLFGGKDAS